MTQANKTGWQNSLHTPKIRDLMPERSDRLGPVLFFSRGKGRGHAVPDAAIAEELIEREPNLDLVFVSYSVGAVTLKKLGCNVIDLGLPEDNGIWATVVPLVQVFQELHPALVISHEEFVAIPVAKAFGLPTVFLTDWFLSPDHPFMQALGYADEIVFMDDAGYYDEPPYLTGKIHYVGTVYRKLRAEKADRERHRALLGIPPKALVILVAPGGAEFHSELRAPLFDLVLRAFEELPVADKRLVWVTGQPDYDALRTRSQVHDSVMIMEPHQEFTSTLLASDLVITKGNRTPVFECDALGIPSISISFGINPIDEYRIARVPTHVALRARGITPDTLRNYLLRALGGCHRSDAVRPIDTSSARLAVTELLRRYLRRALSS